MKHGSLVIVLSLLILNGCSHPASRQGRAQLALAHHQLDQKQFVPAARTLSGFLSREPDSKEAPQAFYLRGLCYRQMEPPKNQRAQKDFQQTIEKHHSGLVRALAYAALGHIYFETRPEEQEKAVQHYQAALKDLQDEPPKDAVLYRLAVALQKLGRFSEADQYLSRCFDTFPDSHFAAYARDRFGARTWSLQFGAFSDQSRARKLVARLNKSGWQCHFLPRRTQGQLLYVVRSGSYHTYEQADKARARTGATEPKPEIVPAPPAKFVE